MIKTYQEGKDDELCFKCKKKVISNYAIILKECKHRFCQKCIIDEYLDKYIQNEFKALTDCKCLCKSNVSFDQIEI